MTEARCRYDRETETHLLRTHLDDCTSNTCDGCQPCTADDHGNPVRHCRCRNRCTSHLAWSEHVCPGCLGKIRNNLTAIVDRQALMPEEAIEQGVESAAAELAGPHADYVTAQWRLVNADRAGYAVDELDMTDPYTCLTSKERAVREDLGHDEHTLVSPTLNKAADYLAWVLTDLARDETQVLVLADLLAATARLRSHLDAVLRDSRAPERGAPCRMCEAPAPRLAMERGHWCDEPECKRQHYSVRVDEATDLIVPDTTGDRWVCPVDRDHWWSQEHYERMVYAEAKAQGA